MSAPNKQVLIGLLLAAVLGGAGIYAAWLFKQPDAALTGTDTPTSLTYKTASTNIGDQLYRLQVADTAGKQELGLGKRDNLPSNNGMIFTYTRDDTRCFWMKDMRFAIDIIWLDGNKKVVHIEPSLTPQTYPKTYCPAEKARYVVEIPAGAAASAGLQTGDSIDFQPPAT